MLRNDQGLCLTRSEYMISHKYKCIFIHIPKCAGTSIESALGHFKNYSGRNRQDHRNIRSIEQPLFTPQILSSKENIYEFMHRILYHFDIVQNPLNKLTVTRKQYKNYFKFTFIRNPWARAYSWYKNVMRDEVHKKNYNLTNQIPLRVFLQLYSGKGMLKPQLYWIKNFHGDIPLDYIGRFETINEDFKKICEALQIPPITLPHIIKGSGESYHDHYDKESIDIVMKTYKEEIEMFGYYFEK